MIRITKMTDYGIVLLSRFALSSDSTPVSVKDLAQSSSLPEPTVSKLLKALSKNGLLISVRGVKGGYQLARRPEAISVAQIIAAIDGPIAITDCAGESGPRCDLERSCPVRSNWQKINVSILDSLQSVSLADMARPSGPGFIPVHAVTRSDVRSQREELCQPVL